MRSPLLAYIAQHSTVGISPGVRQLAGQLRARHGDAVCGIVYYGSCLRSGDEHEGLVDLYVLVDSYDAVYQDRKRVWSNRLLPPNVYYMTTSWQGRPIRCKYALLSLTALLRGTSMRCFHSYLWGRFAQPAGIVYARDEPAREQIYLAFAQAVVTFITRVVPRLPASFDAVGLWRSGLALSYAAELRAERDDRIQGLIDENRNYYETVTRAALKALPFTVDADTGTSSVRYRAAISAPARLGNRMGWQLRCKQGKLLSLLRLIKGVFTFDGGLDYIVWKLERHAGLSIDVTPRLRRHPLVFGWGLLWRLYRQGAFR